MLASCRRRLLPGVLTTLVALAVCAAPASAGPLVESAGPCTDQALEQPFLRWLDAAQYTIAPGGTFEAGAASWSLSGGASPAAGNEPYYVHGAGESASLALPTGSSATSGTACVGIEHPTLRFFAKRTGGSMLGGLRVDVLFEDAGGATRSLTIGSHGNLTGNWAPSAPMLVTANLLVLLPGEHTPVAFRFTPQGNTSWAIDDVYVDPFYR